MPRPKWSTVTIALAVIAALAVASPVFGVSKSIKKAISKEVAKQISGARGPAGANGTNGTNGADGTARAYARVISNTFTACGSPPSSCTFDHQKGVSSVTHPATGIYCVIAPGIDPNSEVATVSVETLSTMVPKGNANVEVFAPHTDCNTAGGGFEVVTEYHPEKTVCTNSAATCATAVVAGTAVLFDDVGFTIVIP